MSNLSIFEELENIEHKDEFECLVRSYQYGHSHMYMWCAGLGRKFRILFHSVKYFNCPKRWKGLYLSQGSEAECWERLLAFKVYSDEVYSEDELNQWKNRNTLYKFKIGDTFAEIIALSALIEGIKK